MNGFDDFDTQVQVEEVFYVDSEDWTMDEADYFAMWRDDEDNSN